MKPSCSHTNKGSCDISVSEHCLDCCRVAHGSSGDGSYNWNWKPTPKSIKPDDQTLAIWNAAIEAAAKVAEKPLLVLLNTTEVGLDKAATHYGNLTAKAIRDLAEKGTETINIRIVHECTSCAGTGLYKGFGEQKDTAAVVCSTCRGSGMFIFNQEFTPFTGRKKRRGVKRVFQCNPGILIGTGGKEPTTGEPLKLEDFGGISHKDWVSGKPFGPGTEMRRYVCPAWWYQRADHEKMPDWKECEWGTFSSCSSFKTKNKCWERFDAEQAAKEKQEKKK